MGGSITASFAAHFLYLVNSIVFLAPVGVLRYLPNDYKSFFYHCPSLVPTQILRRVVSKVLGVTMSTEAEVAGVDRGNYSERPDEI